MPTLTKTDKPLTKTEARRIIARLRRHDPHDVMKRLYVAPARGETWIASSYWMRRLADWPWAPVLPADEPGTYELMVDAVVKVSYIPPVFEPLFPADWPNGQTKAAPVAVDGVRAYTTESRPLLRFGSGAIVAVNLDLVADMLAVPEVRPEVIDGQTVGAYRPEVRFSGDPDHPLKPLTVWRPKDGDWRAVGLLMPVRA